MKCTLAGAIRKNHPDSSCGRIKNAIPEMTMGETRIIERVKPGIVLGIIATSRGIRKVTFHGEMEKVAEYLGGEATAHSGIPSFALSAVELLKEYFQGKETKFNVPLDHEGQPPFFKKIWKVARTIPYGEVRTYGWLAEKAGKPGGMRAAGQAMARNPTPIIVPCHRVIRSDGKLGGFSAGLQWKVKLLELEGVNLHNGNVVF
jgi:methylated-DNA-[protein]-cysteine S-methyltransferase